jgi:hypothetical protein
LNEMRSFSRVEHFRTSKCADHSGPPERLGRAFFLPLLPYHRP